MAAIECKDVSIRYKKGDLQQIGLKDYVIKKLTRTYKVEEFWADKHITFAIESGDMLGIVGTNGAGKSTLLKAITGIMLPTKGTVTAEGKIAALLELSSGFDNELTVKENTYLRGALLGYTRAFMESHYDEIIAFAELEDFQDYAFKQLSSGMKSRLAFSIACLVNPDILILDEVLSVGDEAFKAKSAARIKDILRNGVTGVLVSHSVKQVREICNKVLWLDHGNQIAFGPADVVCDAYTTFLFAPKKKRVLPKDEKELYEISDRYRLAMHLGLNERLRPQDFSYTINPNETEAARIQRLTHLVDVMPPEEKQALRESMEAWNQQNENKSNAAPKAKKAD